MNRRQVSPTHGIEGAIRRVKRRVDGILLFDKPVGPSSNQALQWVKRLFEAEKAGHTGTLDPFASGLLPVMFGEATKFSSFLLDASKEYEATLLLGISTSTGDITGEVLERRPVLLKDEDVREVASSFVGEQWQTPPMHSALKRAGVPLYELARRGMVVEREPRRITIEELVVTRIEGAQCDIRVRCSKGTYVRVLGEEMGKALGCGASLGALRRTAVWPFHVRDSRGSDELEAMRIEDRVCRLLPIDAGLEHLPRLDLDSDSVRRMRLGQGLRQGTGDTRNLPVVRLYDADSKGFVGLGRLIDNDLSPVRLVVPEVTKIA